MAGLVIDPFYIKIMVVIDIMFIAAATKGKKVVCKHIIFNKIDKNKDINLPEKDRADA